MIVLVPIDDDGEDGAPIQFGQPYIHVGHGPHNDLILDDEDPATSYEHALLTVLQGRALVLCDPTAKPTYIDGVDISGAPEDERQLKPGDIISFGKGRSMFRVERIVETDQPGGDSPQQVRVRLRPSKKAASAPPHPPPPTGRAGRPVTFCVFKGDQMVREERFTQPLIRIGRMRSSHLLFDDKSVSRTHAVVEVTADNEVLLMDLDSSAGTSVNGLRVKKALLNTGDQVKFGDVRVIVTYDKSTQQAVPPPIASPPASVDDIEINVEFPSNTTQILSESDWEPLDSPRLVIRRGGTAPSELVLGKPHTTIGRLPTNDLQLDDGAVSGQHALLVAEAGVFVLIDQHSTNGTFLNGKRCTGESLQDGDVIQIGRFELVFVAPRASNGQRQGTEILSPAAARALFAKVGEGGNNPPKR
jgi:pSer/pThr/pTyr-binding forkhead associated (FHA) protein